MAGWKNVESVPISSGEPDGEPGRRRGASLIGVHLTDYADLTGADRDALASAVARLATLEEVVRWGLAQPEPSTVVEVVVQDEYTHDVVMPWCDRYVVFDAT